MSDYQSIKLVLGDVFGISRDGFHIFLAFGVYLVAARLFRFRLSDLRSLVAPLLFAVLLEVKDLHDSTTFGFSINLFWNLHDIVVSMALPLVTSLYLRIGEGKTKEVPQNE
jgi:hypothetical protein